MSDNDAAIEQIAKDVFISDNSNAADPEKEWDNALAADRGYARYIARGLHSLGYTNSIVHQCCVDAEATKPRTITTVYELDVLPVRSVVLAHWVDGSQPDYTMMRCAEGGASSRGYGLADKRHWLGMANWGAVLTVLYEPAQ
ncbi:hypothetical protein ART_1586 [Arthrobacter sp. PAMC 25486]|uniref:hypothetical protein n=1 Tax=Arthrobacter sp. PAMC 25486 TaxID=1494608 RepID=UPI0005361B37|nr:hypothetical protein [Arthrobacter sp. PAMC 25486]AIY01185.1 hypothetical protein ART_1586 [Arthrobacter sp. PAMC 25486]